MNEKTEMIVRPLRLEGSNVRLEPLTTGHFDGLCDAGLIDEIWQWYPVAPILTRDQMRQTILTALDAQEKGTELPFVIIDKKSNRIAGSSRYLAIEPLHRRLEIGWTWLHPDWQRTHVNTETKYLMLKHAFDVLGCHRVEFKIDSLNRKSRSALLRIGAREEGTLRNHMVTWNGRMRDSVYFSIIDSEWMQVKEMLENRLIKTARIDE